MPEWFGPSKDILLLILAVWGAALSTFNWWSARSKESRQIKVSLTTKIPTYTSGEMGTTFACVEAVNVGHRPVKIDYLAIELPDGRTLLPMFHNELPGMPNTKLPVILGDGESAILAYPYSEIGHGLRRAHVERTHIYPIATDTAGNKHRGKAWKVTAKELISGR